MFFIIMNILVLERGIKGGYEFSVLIIKIFMDKCIY